MAAETDPRFSGWVNRVLNSWPFLMEDSSIVPLSIVAVGLKRDGVWKWFYLDTKGRDLFRDGVFSFRLALPFLVAGVVTTWNTLIWFN